MMKYCDECGEKIKENQKFCSNCGKSIKNKELETDEHEKHSKITCPNCGSNNVQVQLVSQSKNTGCLTILLYIILALTIVGIPIMILIIVSKGKNSVNREYCVCQSCGKTFNLNSNYKPLDEKQKKIIGIVCAVLIPIICIMIALPIALKDTDYIDFDQYQQIDVQQLHNDYLDNEISAKKKYEGNYYYFSGEIHDIEEFLNDTYLEIRYTSSRDKSKIIELNAYFNSSKELEDVKKKDKVTVYCKFNKRTIEDYYGITSYSFGSCRFKEEESKN